MSIKVSYAEKRFTKSSAVDHKIPYFANGHAGPIWLDWTRAEAKRMREELVDAADYIDNCLEKKEFLHEGQLPPRAGVQVVDLRA